jgi:exosortase B
MAAVLRARDPGYQGLSLLSLPPKLDLAALALLIFGFLALYLPSYLMLAQRIWSTDEQGHGPIILALSFYLLYAKRFELAHEPAAPATLSGGALLLFGTALYAFGRSQYIMFFEILSQIFVLAGLSMFFLGWRSLRIVWFPLFFMLFMVPLPGSVVAEVTGPLKAAVSAVASNLLYQAGYPVGRSGVVLTVGPYQLLVADACAGLNSMFTLEALGLLYMHFMRYTSAVRNTLLAILIIPISFIANILRVMILVLVTYHFGDEAGQGFVHGFAGMVLFMAGLVLMLATDALLRTVFGQRSKVGA